MLPLLPLLLLPLAFVSQVHEAKAEYTPPYSSLYLQLRKHTDSDWPLYSLQIGTSYVNSHFLTSNFLIDIDAPFSYRECIVQWNMYPGSCPDNSSCTSPVSCDEYQCTEVRTSYSPKSPYCPPVRNVSTSDGAFCMCPVNALNPVNGYCTQPFLNYDTYFVNTSNGRNPTPSFYAAFSNAACGTSSSFDSFPKNVVGVIALSDSSYAFPPSLNQVTLRRTFSLCLPSTVENPGIMFYGNGPYYFDRPRSDIDVTSLLLYTPMLKHPNPFGFGYFIGVNSIVIKTRSIQIEGNFTAKLSTIEPYTALRSDIYNQVVRRFSKVTKRIPSADPIAPFDVCFSSFRNGSKVSFRVPDIEFGLTDGKKWAVSTPNSIKRVTDDMACLAFVDGGSTTEYAVVIGTFQFEDNFLMFDLENSTFGFSSSLLRKQTSCSSFNFTAVSS